VLPHDMPGLELRRGEYIVVRPGAQTPIAVWRALEYSDLQAIPNGALELVADDAAMTGRRAASRRASRSVSTVAALDDTEPGPNREAPAPTPHLAVVR